MFREIGIMFSINPNWSMEAIRCAFEQEQDGQVRVISAAGSKAISGERNYLPTKGMLDVIIYMLRKVEQVLR